MLPPRPVGAPDCPWPALKINTDPKKKTQPNQLYLDGHKRIDNTIKLEISVFLGGLSLCTQIGAVYTDMITKTSLLAPTTNGL